MHAIKEMVKFLYLFFTGIENGNNIEVILQDGCNTVSVTSDNNLENSNTNANFAEIPVSLECNSAKVLNKVDNLDSDIVSNDQDVAALLGNSVQSSDGALPTITLASDDFSATSEDVKSLTNTVSNSNEVTTTQSLKRQLSSTTPPVVHKVIITKNPNSDQL